VGFTQYLLDPEVKKVLRIDRSVELRSRGNRTRLWLEEKGEFFSSAWEVAKCPS
jgi:hypothetical protein